MSNMSEESLSAEATYMDKQLQKLIDLSNKTGDRLIAFDPRNEDQAYVVMGVDDYEKLAVGRSEVRGLTEEELIDKINRDIAVWKSDRELEGVREKGGQYIDFDDEYEHHEGEEFDDDEFMGVEDDWYSIDDITKESDFRKRDEELYSKNDNSDKKRQKSGAWKIPSDRVNKAEEVIDEDRYYLEDIED